MSYATVRQCGINIICEANDVDLHLVNMGVKGEVDHPAIDNHKLMDGTNNFVQGIPAMPMRVVEKAVQIGFDYAVWAKDAGYDILGTGEVGMANTTMATACILAVLECMNPKYVGMDKVE